MHFTRAVVALVLSFALRTSVFGQQTAATGSQSPPQRDAQAVAIVQQSAAAIAVTPPSDSSASGTVTVVEGSTTQNGSIQILTLGISQTAETLYLPNGQRSIIYSSGNAKETNGFLSLNPPFETILTDRCPDFPLPSLLAALNNPDVAFRYVAAETLDGVPAQHVQFWNSFASKPRLRNLALFSLNDIWLDATSGLPLKIAYSRRAGGGSSPAIPVEISFSNWTEVNGVFYPFSIRKSFNGTPWIAITISSVSFNTGLTASQFPVE